MRALLAFLISLLFACPVRADVIGFTQAAMPTGAGTIAYAIWDQNAGNAASPASSAVVMTFNGTAQSFTCGTSGASGAGSWTVDLLKSSDFTTFTATGVTCTMTNPAVSCTSASTVNFAAADAFAFRITSNSATTTTAKGHCSFQTNGTAAQSSFSDYNTTSGGVSNVKAVYRTFSGGNMTAQRLPWGATATKIYCWVANLPATNCVAPATNVGTVCAVGTCNGPSCACAGTTCQTAGANTCCGSSSVTAQLQRSTDAVTFTPVLNPCTITQASGLKNCAQTTLSQPFNIGDLIQWNITGTGTPNATISCSARLE